MDKTENTIREKETQGLLCLLACWMVAMSRKKEPSSRRKKSLLDSTENRDSILMQCGLNELGCEKLTTSKRSC